MNRDQAKEDLRKMNNIIDQWEKNELESYEAMEMISPLLKTIAAYLDLEQIPGSEEKKSLYEDLEKDLDKENGDPPVFEPESQQEDLFSKSEDLEKEEED